MIRNSFQLEFSGLRALIAGLALLFALLPAVALAQTATASSPGEEKAELDKIVLQVEQLTTAIENKQEDDAALVELRLQLEGIAENVLIYAVEFRPRLQEIRRRLDQLGPPPGENDPPEPETLAEERVSLANEKAEINALIGEAEQLSVTVNKLIDKISTLRRDLFARTLSKRYDISFALGRQTLTDFWSEAGQLYNTFSYWIRFTVRFRIQPILLATFFSFVAALVIFVGGRRYFGPLLRTDSDVEQPSYLSRLSVAFWSTLLPTFALAVFLNLTYFLFDTYDILRGDVATILRQLFNVILVVFFINRLAHRVLNPALPRWRLVPVQTDAARTLVWLITATAVITSIDFLLATTFDVLGSPLKLSVAASLIASVLVGLLVIAIGSVRPLLDDESRPSPWPRIMRYPVFVIGIATIIIAFFGYIGLARFIIQQIVVTGGILTTMYIGVLSANAVTAEGAFQNSRFGIRLGEIFGLSETAVDRMGIVVSFLINILVLAWGLPLILLQWGFQWGDIQAWALSTLQQINIGTVSFSIVGLFTGVVVFFIGYFLTRVFQRWLDRTVLSRSRIDSGVRNSIRTSLGYAGIALAALIGVSAAGINLSSLALVAGALSLGIGFGLQNIVSNFVSGLILLAERPFKAGDWIVAGGVEGTVKRVNVRATEIETFQRQTVIMPNSELINAAVGNWTHRNSLGRVDIPIGVAYGSDVHRVREILIDLASTHELVIKNPEPAVIFMDFGASSLDFQLRMYLYDISNVMVVQNDLRFAIYDAFAKEGIEIPFPQRDINIKGDLAAALKAKPAAKPRGASAKPAPAKAAPAKPKRRSKRKLDPDE
ncbi:MAG: mechanosensitive ion channel domain-containing protein [Rhizobiaceae bacterium]